MAASAGDIDAAALLPLAAHVAGLEEGEGGRHDVGVDVAQDAAPPDGVEVEALEAELGAPLVGLAVEHEAAADHADRLRGGCRRCLCVHLVPLGPGGPRRVSTAPRRGPASRR